MNASRIRLSRIIAFNWYGFRTIIDVNGLTLLCGETGTGKSALLDLIQFVMTAGAVKFNKAAAGDSNARDLRGYCLCNTNTRQRDGQPRYLRRSGATIAALEFTWPSVADEEPRRETWGIRVQFESPSAQPSYVRFVAPCRMERADLCDDTGSLLSEELFRLHVKRELGGDAGFTSHKGFQEEMGVARHLHFDDEQMRKTLPKAIAFELDSDYQRFIREFILEPSPPDVASTRRSLEALRQAEERVGQLHDQQQRLERIAVADREYQAAHREASLFGHLRHALDHAEAQEKVDRMEAALISLCDKHAENQTRLDKAVADKDSAQRQLDDVKFIAGKEDPKLGDFDRLRREERNLAEHVESLVTKTKTAREFLTERALAWEQWQRYAATISWDANVDSALLTALKGADTSRALDSVARLVREFHNVWSVAKDRLQPKLNEIEALKKEETRLENQLTQLHDNRTAATPLLDRLRSTGTAAHTLARVVEVSTEGELWWGVIETLLGDDRNAVLVNSGNDYLRARELWMKMPKAEPLIHPDEIPVGPPVANALTSFLETGNPVARRFLDWKLGQISAVSETDKLVNHPHAAAPEGSIKEGPVLRHVTPEKDFTLGEEGLRRLRTAKQLELDLVSEKLKELKRECDDVHQWLKRGKESQLDQDNAPRGSSEIHQLPGLREQLQQTRNAIRLIETPDLHKRLASLRQLESDLAAANQTIGELKTPITEFEIKRKKLDEEIGSAHQELSDTGLNLHENRLKLPPGVLDDDIAKLLNSAVGSPTSWKHRRDQADWARDTKQKEAASARELRQQERYDLLANPKHCDEFGEFDAQDDSNARFDLRLEQIREHDVQHYTTIAADRRADWEKRLQEDVLDRLSERLKDARRTVEEFRRILSREIGGYRYVLSQKRDPLHHAMWKLIDQSGDGLQASDDLLDWKLQEEIGEAKRELMLAIDQPDDKRAAALLDYRNYHRYDLDMVPIGHADDTEGRISLQHSGRNLSGGEGQAPFFVAMLAAFHRVYDRGQRGRHSNLGLVVMDEAFSKLSAGHIADCLSLAEGFGLQLILAFPMDRLGTMVQHADSIIQCRVEKRSDVNGLPEQIINDVIYWNRDRAAVEFVP
jgi:uncharacterized protein YPO0396